MTQLKEGLEEKTSLAEVRSEKITELEKAAKESTFNFEKERDLLQERLNSSQASIQELKEQNKDLSTHLSQLKSVSENLRKEKELLVLQLEQLQMQVTELESHQMDATSLYKEYKQLKSINCEFKSLKRSHEEMEDALRAAHETTQTQLLQLEKQRNSEKEISSSRILQLNEEIAKTRNSELNLKLKYQEKVEECFNLKDRFTNLEIELNQNKIQMEDLKNQEESKIEELEQYIAHLRGQSMVFPLSKTKKQRLNPSPKDDHQSIEISAQSSPQQLLIHCTELVKA